MRSVAFAVTAFATLFGHATGYTSVPSSPVPENYDIILRPMLNESVVKGRVNIHLLFDNETFSRFDNRSQWDSTDFTIQVNRASDLTMNVSVIHLECSDINSSVETSTDAKWESYDSESELSTIVFQSTVQAVWDAYSQEGCQQWTLSIPEFTATLRTSEQQSGIYMSEYSTVDSQGNERLVRNVVTHFESANARAGFPCLDEPSLKAKMGLTLMVPQGTVVLSNMAEDTRQSAGTGCAFTFHDGRTTDDCESVSFQQSPPMSTFLVAFVVGDWQSQNQGNNSVYYPWNSADQDGQYALSELSHFQPFFSDLFGVPFPLSKLDCVVVEDSPVQPAPNWGLMMFRPRSLLTAAVKNGTSVDSYKRVSLAIARSLSNQWFGGLVTLQWWNDLWLSEGFAGYAALLAVDRFHPGWLIYEDWMLRMDRVMEWDTNSLSPTVLQTVDDPRNISSFLNSYLSDKSTCLIRMLAEMLDSVNGAATFMSGVQQYLSDYAYSNAEHWQLWDALNDQQSDINCNDFMSFWISFTSNPQLIEAQMWNETEERMMSFFNLDMTDETLYDDHYYGHCQYQSMPIWMMNANQSAQIWQFVNDCETNFEQFEPVIVDEDGQQVEYYVLNPMYLAYTRAAYTIDDDTDEMYMFRLIQQSIGYLSSTARIGVFADQSSLMKNNYTSVSHFLDSYNSLISSLNSFMDEYPERYRDELSSAVWTKVIEGLKDLSDYFCEYSQSYTFDYFLDYTDESYMSVIEQYVQISEGLAGFSLDMLTPVWDFIGGWDSDGSANNTYDTRVLRPRLASALTFYGSSEVISEGYQILQNAQYNVSRIPIDLLSAVLEASIAADTDTVTDWMISAWPQWNSEQRERAAMAIGAAYINQDSIVDAIQFLLSSEVSSLHRILGLQSCRRCHGRFAVWEQVFDDSDVWSALYDEYERDPEWLAKLTELPQTFSSDYMTNSIQDFYYGDPRQVTAAIEGSANRTIRDAWHNAQWAAAWADDTYEWLEENDYISSDSDDSDDGFGDCCGGGDWNFSPAWWFYVLVIVGPILAIVGCVAIGYYVWKRRKEGQTGTYHSMA